MAFRGYISTYLDGSLVKDKSGNVVMFKSKEEVDEFSKEYAIYVEALSVVDLYRRRGPKRKAMKE